MRLVTCVLVIGILAGCSAKYDLSGAGWQRPGATIREVTYDEMQCVRDAREAGATPDPIVGGVADVVRYFIEEKERTVAHDRCMIVKGYQPRT
jgi:hypothetical protein